MRLVVSLLVALLSWSASAQVVSRAPALRIALRGSEVSNYLYQLDCVSGAIAACGRADYAALWQAEFLRSAADSASLAAWKTLRRRYERYVAIDTQRARRTGFDLGEKVRLAGMQSESIEAFLVRLDLLVLPEDVVIGGALVRDRREQSGGRGATVAASRGVARGCNRRGALMVVVPSRELCSHRGL